MHLLHRSLNTCFRSFHPNLITMKHFLTLLLLVGTASAACAHTGHGVQGLHDGLAHPFGLDHLLAMVAVGAWSASALKTTQRWWGPATFVTVMSLGALMGAAGVQLPGAEVGVAASVVLLGLMLVMGRQTPPSAGLLMVVTAAVFHGFVHGAERPVGGSFAAYAIGFLVVTAALHAAGVGMGVLLQGGRSWLLRWLGAGMGATGLVMLTSV